MYQTSPSSIPSQERHRTSRSFALLFTVYMVFYMAMFFAKPVKDSPLAWVLGVGVGLSMAAMLAAAAIGLARQRDEFQRKLLFQSAMWGIGGMLATTIVWGMLEVTTSIPRLPILANFPIFLVITLIAKLSLFRRLPPSQE